MRQAKRVLKNEKAYLKNVKRKVEKGNRGNTETGISCQESRKIQQTGTPINNNVI